MWKPACGFLENIDLACCKPFFDSLYLSFLTSFGVLLTSFGVNDEHKNLGPINWFQFTSFSSKLQTQLWVYSD
jgi:hypothetical protein